MDAAAREMKLDPRRAAPPQHDPARADAVHEPDGADLRQRRVREDPRPGPRAGRLERLRRARAPSRRRAASCAAAASRPSSNGPAATCSRRRVTRRRARPTASSRSSRRRRRWARASRPATRSSRSTSSACRSSRIRIVQGDTDRGNGFGSAGSRSLFTGGSAVQVASEQTVDHAQDARRRGARGGGRRHRIPRRALQRRRHRPRHRPVRARRQAAGASASTSTRTSTVGGPTWPNGCHVCEVEIDPETGDVAVVAYASVNDIGRVVSPMIVARPGRRRRGAGHRPGAVRAGRLRPETAASR